MNIKYVLILLLTCTYDLSQTSAIYNNFIVDIYSKYKPVSYIVGMCMCLQKSETIDLMKTLSNAKIHSAFPSEKSDTFYSLKVPDTGGLGILINNDCEESKALLKLASDKMFFNRTYKWLVLTENETDHNIIFQNLSIFIEAEITLAVRKNGLINIYDIYGYMARDNQPLEKNYTGFYTDETGLIIKPQSNKYHVRNNFHKYAIRAGTVISRRFDKREMFDLLTRSNPSPGVTGFTKYHHDLILVARDIFNFSIDYTVDEVWDGQAANGTHLGLIGALTRREIDIFATAVYASGRRPDWMDFINGFWIFHTALLYRVSSLPGAIDESLSKPFENEVWVSTALMLICILLILKISSRAGNVFYSWSFSTLFTIAALSQQGIDPGPALVAQRIASLVLYVATFLLYNYYSASIVGILLNTQPKGLNTIEEIANSSLTVVFEDVDYARILVTERFFPGMDELYEKKLKVPRNKNQPNVFVTNDQALMLLKHGGVAYHTEVYSAYPQIGNLFDEVEICELRMVNVYQKVPLYVGIPKLSPIKKMFTVGYLKAKQYGLARRLSKMRTHKKPLCTTSLVYPVSWDSVVMAFNILGLGVAISIILLILEYVTHHGSIYSKNRALRMRMIQKIKKRPTLLKRKRTNYYFLN